MRYGEAIALGPDGFGVFGAALIAGAGALVLVAIGDLTKQLAPRLAPFAFALALAGVGGWCGAMMARDLIGFVLSVEIGWLAGVALAALAGSGIAWP
ncbi:MAG: hypothetical protein NVV62_19390 [Terricaulis sp.]|nr:hypothetical protein [Terricaulis sp.]